MPDEPFSVSLQGFHVIRSATYLRAHSEEDEGLTWALVPAVTDVVDDGAVVIGDLTVRTASVFAGVQIMCYLQVEGRSAPLGEDDWETLDLILEQNADRMTHSMYDFAAMALRSQMAGFIVPVDVPPMTPPHELRLARDVDGRLQSYP